MANKLYTTWHVSEDEDVKLVLASAQICELEEKMGGRNLMRAIGNSETGIPSLRTMITITHAAMQRYNHGTKLADVYGMFDRYVENGGNQVSFYTDVYVPIFQVSGFFPREEASDPQTLQDAAAKAQETSVAVL